MVVRKQRGPALFSPSWEHTPLSLRWAQPLGPWLQSIHFKILPFCDKYTVLDANVFILPLNHSFLVWPDRGRGVEQAAEPWVIVVAGGLIAGVVRCSVLSARHLTPRGISCSPGIVLDEEGPRQERSLFLFLVRMGPT